MRTVLTRPLLYVLPPPLDEITLANALVLKDPPLDLIDTAHMPNFVRCMHHDLKERLGTTVMLPNLHHSKFVGIYSDYGGDESESDYLTYSFLIVSLDGIGHCLAALRKIREQHGLLSPHTEVSFKNLNYGPIERALPQWLAAIDGINGLLFTLMVDKRAQSVVTRNSKQDLRNLADDMQAKDRGKWRKAHVAERFMRVANCIAYWCAVLCRQDQQVLWLSDNDAIAENSLVKAMTQVTMSAMTDYRSDLHVTFSFATDSQLSERHEEFREFLSYPDLAAGSLANLITRALPSSAAFGSHRVPGGPGTKTKALTIARWLAWQRIGLKKATFICRPEGQGIRGVFGGITVDDIPENTRFVPINPQPA